MNIIRRVILALALSASLTPAFGQSPPPVPTLPDAERRTSYSITASTCNCNINFAIFGDSTDVGNWVQVWVNGVQVPQSGNWTITSPTGPLATIPRPITDAVLTFTTAQTGTVEIVGARRPRRLSQFGENRGVAARDLNLAITDLVAENREQWDALIRTMTAPPGDTQVPMVLPSASNRASKILGFDANGGVAIYSQVGGGTGNVTGPVSSINNDLACFNGTTGQVIKDCGTGLPLALTQGGTGQTSAATARGSSGLNIDQYTPRGDSIYTILSTDRTVGTNAAFTAARIWTLPAANSVNAGQTIVVADFAGGVSSSNTLTVQRAGSDTIVGGTTSTTAVIAISGGRLDFRSDGISKWSVATKSASTSTNLGTKTPMDYSAACDGTTDDSTALQAWLDGIKTNAFTGWIPAGRTCIFNGLLSISSGTTIYAYGATLKLKNSGNANSGLVCGPTTQLGGPVDVVNIFGGTLDGNRVNQTNSLGSGAGLYCISATRVHVRDTKSINWRVDGFYFGGTTAGGGQGKSAFVFLENLEASGNYRTGMSVVGVDRMVIIGGFFNSTSNTNNDGTQCGVDFEPDAATSANTNITVVGASASGNGGTLSTTGGSGFCVLGSPSNTQNLVLYGLNAVSNQRYGIDTFASGGPPNVRLSAMSGSGNGTALVNTSNVVDWFPTGIAAGAANSGGAGFRTVNIPN
ncbi:hypothetical protein XI09_26350 [Bradyrhizobium sp. CCBAU 11386]|uniref:hypothetical protein n=1 Tax=Bradyrhizobium sp. CCBAU 11386 TaxID=1630837 RepID=UPI002302B1B0|nr:hypothetical protein [Bradyrhizobium sp. CCBAU 11386]MDA9508095.1 hypothetical protein [Bradyrhizobium sp. CCBAU 11386]